MKRHYICEKLTNRLKNMLIQKKKIKNIFENNQQLVEHKIINKALNVLFDIRRIISIQI